MIASVIGLSLIGSSWFMTSATAWNLDKKYDNLNLRHMAFEHCAYTHNRKLPECDRKLTIQERFDLLEEKKANDPIW